MWHKLAGLVVCILAEGLIVPGTVRADGGVYAMTNALGNNEIVVFHRYSNGTLAPMQTIATGGGGSGIQRDPTDSLGSQGGLVLDQEHGRLFTVNTESLAENKSDCQQGTISSFGIAPDGHLELVNKISSGGLFPASLTVNENLLYVLNAGGPGLNPTCDIAPNITGFKMSAAARLRLFANASQPIDPGISPASFLNCDPGGFPDGFECGLNPPAFPRSPAQIGFTPDKRALVVTVKGTNSIYVFPLNRRGRPDTPTITQVGNPNQPTPFGFAFTHKGDRGKGQLIVTEPFGATPTIPKAPFSAVSSFVLRKDGTLKPISSSVPNGRGTACWIAIDPTSRYAYIANNATSDISSYRIGDDGSLTLLNPTAAGGSQVNKPNDLAVAKDEGGNFLYVLNSGNGTIGSFQINNDGSLKPLGTVSGLPADAGAQGLAAY